MSTNNDSLREFNFSDSISSGLLICAGGFEDRSIAFLKKLKISNCSFENSILLHYESLKENNESNCIYLKNRIFKISDKNPEIISVHADKPNQSFKKIKEKIDEIALKIINKTALIDISGMTHLWATTTIHACVSCGFETTIIYTEARWYFPLKQDEKKLLRAWREKDAKIYENYLQSTALKAIHILPEFGGNYRPGHKTCLIVFAGHEPNRIEGLVDDYAPARLIVLYGKSPHKEFKWRTQLSKDLHKDLFSKWHLREIEISTLQLDETLATLETEFQIIREHYDVAITPMGSKMQALAVYLFWRRHPEIQLVFTTPIKFNPDRYSRQSRRTFLYKI